MKICITCKRNVAEINDGDIISEYTEQADYYGMENLTENQQLLVNMDICEECYSELE